MDLSSCNKQTLKNLAIENGLTSKGFNGRSKSRMRKEDFIEFILQAQRDQSGSLSSDNEIEQFLFAPVIYVVPDPEGIWRPLPFGQRVLDPEMGLEETNVKTKRVAVDEDEVLETIDISLLESPATGEDLETVKRLIRDAEGKLICTMCKCNARNTVFRPCNHLASCISCAANPLLVGKCPMCREPFSEKSRVYL
jgi:hypothetical protein